MNIFVAKTLSTSMITSLSEIIERIKNGVNSLQERGQTNLCYYKQRVNGFSPQYQLCANACCRGEMV